MGQGGQDPASGRAERVADREVGRQRGVGGPAVARSPPLAFTRSVRVSQHVEGVAAVVDHLTHQVDEQPTADATPRFGEPGSAPPEARRHRGSDRDHDLSADSALLEQPHGVGRLVERIAPVHARDDLAVFDEAGEPFEVGGALFRHEQHQTLPQEG
jgi:hypothetical protein